MKDAAPTSYDELPYKSRAVSTTHPDRLASVAVLYGLKPPPVERCRVLELGCADGGNLLLLSQSIPSAEFVGIDLSPRQIEDGKRQLESLEVANVTLRAMSLMDVDDGFGRFDYIICHGVYSWVPDPVKAKVLSICARNLTPEGVAYISFNAYPGWHMRGMVRDIMRYHTRGMLEPAERVKHARAILNFLARSAQPPDGFHAQALRHEAAKLAEAPDHYVFHEHLEDDNHPLYFHEFAARVGEAGLRYLGDVRFHILEADMKAQASEFLGTRVPDRTELEQYFDFMGNQTFRQCLLTRAENAPSPHPMAEAVPKLRYTTMARCDSPRPDVSTEAPVPFVTIFGDTLNVGRPALKAAVLTLFDGWPRSASFDELFAECRMRLGRTEPASEPDRAAFATVLLQGHMANLINFHVYDPPIDTGPAVRPRAGAIVRRQVERNEPVVSLRMGAAELDDLEKLLILHLDGTNDHASIVEALTGQAVAGALRIDRAGATVTERAQARAILEEVLKGKLRAIARKALLVSHEGRSQSREEAIEE